MSICDLLHLFTDHGLPSELIDIILRYAGILYPKSIDQALYSYNPNIILDYLNMVAYNDDEQVFSMLLQLYYSSEHNYQDFNVYSFCCDCAIYNAYDCFVTLCNTLEYIPEDVAWACMHYNNIRLLDIYHTRTQRPVICKSVRNLYSHMDVFYYVYNNINRYQTTPRDEALSNLLHGLIGFHNYEAQIKFLLEQGVKFNERDLSTMISCATFEYIDLVSNNCIFNGEGDTISYIIETCIDKEDQHSYLKVLKLLINEGYPLDKNVLLQAIHAHAYELVPLLLDAGCHKHRKALSVFKTHRLSPALKESAKKAFMLLIREGLPIPATVFSTLGPFIDDIEIMTALLNRGVNPKSDPILWFIKYGTNRHVAQILLNANLEITDDHITECLFTKKIEFLELLICDNRAQYLPAGGSKNLFLLVLNSNLYKKNICDVFTTIINLGCKTPKNLMLLAVKTLNPSIVQVLDFLGIYKDDSIVNYIETEITNPKIKKRMLDILT